MADGPSPRALVDFHTRHKLLLMAHSVELYRELGRLVAEAGGPDARTLPGRYFPLLQKALSLLPTTRKHTNVLSHVQGYFKRVLSADERQELTELVGRYHAGLVPLVVPVTLLNHYVRKYGQDYLAAQVYLNPYPAELMLRNHV